MPARPLYTGANRRSGASEAVERGDVGQVAVEPVVVQAVAHHEHVGDREADIVDRDVRQPPAALVEEHARAYAARPRAPRARLRRRALGPAAGGPSHRDVTNAGSDRSPTIRSATCCAGSRAVKEPTRTRYRALPGVSTWTTYAS